MVHILIGSHRRERVELTFVFPKICNAIGYSHIANWEVTSPRPLLSCHLSPRHLFFLQAGANNRGVRVRGCASRRGGTSRAGSWPSRWAFAPPSPVPVWTWACKARASSIDDRSGMDRLVLVSVSVLGGIRMGSTIRWFGAKSVGSCHSSAAYGIVDSWYLVIKLVPATRSAQACRRCASAFARAASGCRFGTARMTEPGAGARNCGGWGRGGYGKNEKGSRLPPKGQGLAAAKPVNPWHET